MCSKKTMNRWYARFVFKFRWQTVRSLNNLDIDDCFCIDSLFFLRSCSVVSLFFGTKVVHESFHFMYCLRRQFVHWHLFRFDRCGVSFAFALPFNILIALIFKWRRIELCGFGRIMSRNKRVHTTRFLTMKTKPKVFEAKKYSKKNHTHTH